MWEVTFICFNVISLLLYLFLTRKYNYWQKLNVPYLKPQFFFGNYKDYMLQRTFVGNVTKKLYEQLPNERYIGVFFGTEPTLLVQDPDLLKLIMTKDFYYFHGREISKYARSESVTQVIFFNSGDHWKIIRQNLSPLFSSAKIKNMFPHIVKCTKKFDKMLEYETKASSYIETNNLTTRFMMDCVGLCAFGLDINLMEEGYEKNPFKSMGDMLVGNTYARGYKNIIRSIWPKLFYTLGLQLFPPEAKESLIKLVNDVLKLRHVESSHQNDFVNWILNMKANEYLAGDTISKRGESKKKLIKFNDDIIAGQCAAFFPGGYETSSTTLTLILFELAKSPKYQSIVQKEIDEYFKNGTELRYDCLSKLPYVAACFDETLRLHPVFTNITREVMEDYTLPTGLHLDKGVRIHIPVYYIHRNPRNFSEPDEFQLERFLPDNKHKIKPFTYLPFGEGPRVCIGMRFARMQVLTGLITVLKNYDISLANGMSSTVEFTPRMLISHTAVDINLIYKRRERLT